ncbi:MAG: hypothetical protein M3P83_10325 [Actinomycetota bacterium]|nr:hypothetical protein [Actinomycetota bacterium]
MSAAVPTPGGVDADPWESAAVHAVLDAAGGPAAWQHLHDHPAPARRAVARWFQHASLPAVVVYAGVEPATAVVAEHRRTVGHAAPPARGLATGQVAARHTWSAAG